MYYEEEVALTFLRQRCGEVFTTYSGLQPTFWESTTRYKIEGMAWREWKWTSDGRWTLVGIRFPEFLLPNLGSSGHISCWISGDVIEAWQPWHQSLLLLIYRSILRSTRYYVLFKGTRKGLEDQISFSRYWIVAWSLCVSIVRCLYLYTPHIRWCHGNSLPGS